MDARPIRTKLTDSQALEEREALAQLKLRRAKPMRPAASPISRAVIKDILPLMKDAGVPLVALEANWEEIVGPRLAPLTRPVKITRGKTGRVLVIEAPSAAAPMIQHQSGLIIDRARLGGAGQIKALKVQQTQSPKTKAPTRREPERRPLSQDERAKLDSGLAEIESSSLRAALSRLGEAILTRR